MFTLELYPFLKFLLLSIEGVLCLLQLTVGFLQVLILASVSVKQLVLGVFYSRSLGTDSVSNVVSFSTESKHAFINL